jgi:hypothetical protein
MESKYLLENEAIISQSKNSELVLTNIRIRYTIKGTGNQRITSIFLEKMSAIETQHKSYPLLLFLGIVSGCIGIYLMMERGMELGQIGFVAAGILILIYAATHKRIILITSDGGAKISYQTRGMRKEAIAHFINDIEKAKNEQYYKSN